MTQEPAAKIEIRFDNFYGDPAGDVFERCLELNKLGCLTKRTVESFHPLHATQLPTVTIFETLVTDVVSKEGVDEDDWSAEVKFLGFVEKLILEGNSEEYSWTVNNEHVSDYHWRRAA